MTRAGGRDERQHRFAGQVRALVWSGAVEVFGAVRHEDPVEGYQLLTRPRLDDPLAGVRAALLVRAVADAQLDRQATDARAAGRSWDEIGEALGLPDEAAGADRPRGEAAFEWLVAGREPEPPDRGGLFREPVTSWRCGTCGALVSDRGPFEFHPDDQESGHAQGCARHAAEVAVWRDSWADES